MPRKTETATLGGGCFWCLEAVYKELDGVIAVTSGYAGGNVPDPSYEDVCSGSTGHAEVVQVAFDAESMSYREVLEVFFSIHDPTTKDRQGGDVGTQYRSIILTHDETQQEVADALLRELAEEDLFDAPIITEVTPLETFYPAEAYHQDYFERNPYQPYCRAVVAPKLAKFRKKWQARLRPQP